MILCVYDIESTGLDVQRDSIIELGWCLYDSDSKHVYQKACYLLQWPDLEIESHLTEIHGIDTDLVSRFGRPSREVLELFLGDVELSDYVVAHNGRGFDEPILKSNLSRLSIPFHGKPNIDTKVDIPYPKSMKSRRLIHLAAEHGVQIRRAHRALDDVEMLVDIVSGYDMERIIETRERRELKRLKI